MSLTVVLHRDGMGAVLVSRCCVWAPPPSPPPLSFSYSQIGSLLFAGQWATQGTAQLPPAGRRVIARRAFAPFVSLMMEAAAGVQGLVATGFFMGCELLLRAPPAKRWITAQLTKPGEVLDEKQKAILFQQATSRIVAEVFNIVALPLAILVLTDPAMWEDRLRSNSVISNVLIMFCSGYFIHDTFVCGSQVHHEGFLYLFHAVSCMSIYTYGMISGLQHLYGAVFILFEASTPLVHIHW
mmetsp:Transcript_38845/g.109917  ORF Transcript_38845/g.109917 Transcript_38845/m.109917 type:complete len:240 (+) Transcript_38845:128-847(+)